MKTCRQRHDAMMLVFDAVQNCSCISRSGRVVSPISRKHAFPTHMAHETTKTAIRIEMGDFQSRSENAQPRIRRTPVNCSPPPTSPSRLFVRSPPKPFAYAYNADKKRPPAGFRLENPAGGRITTSVAWKSDLRRDGRMQCQHHAGMVPERIGDWLGAMPVDRRRAMRTGSPARIARM